MKNNLKNRLSASIKNEVANIDKRFDSADTILLKTNNKPSSLKKAIKCTFTFPHETVDLIDFIISKIARSGKIINKSEVIRLALEEFTYISDERLVKSIDKLERLRRGR
jgi:hypothetical protein